MRTLYYIFIMTMLMICSCSESYKDRAVRIVNEWQGKEFYFSHNATDIILRNSPDDIDFTVISYMDSTICSSCRIGSWLRFVEDLSSNNPRVRTLLILSPSIRNTTDYMQLISDSIPFCIDEGDEMYIRNVIPQEDIFRTFLLDKENKVVLIGNPILKENVKLLYKKRINEIRENFSE